MHTVCRSQWPGNLQSGSAAARLLGLRVRILPEEWMSVVIVLSGRGLCIGLNTRPTECDRAASIMRRPWPRSGCYAMTKKNTDWVTASQAGKHWFDLRQRQEIRCSPTRPHQLSDQLRHLFSRCCVIFLRGEKVARAYSRPTTSVQYRGWEWKPPVPCMPSWHP